MVRFASRLVIISVLKRTSDRVCRWRQWRSYWELVGAVFIVGLSVALFLSFAYSGRHFFLWISVTNCALGFLAGAAVGSK